jgi:ArsR family transcriptional regulator
MTAAQSSPQNNETVTMGHLAAEPPDPMAAGAPSRPGAARRTALDRDRAAAIAARMKAVAHPIRLQVLSQVLNAGAAGASMRQIHAHVSVGRPTIGHHLNVLREAGLVTRADRYPAVFAATPAAHKLLPVIEALGGYRIPLPPTADSTKPSA